MKQIPEDIQTLLNEEAHRINKLSFIEEDPVQFPRLFDSLPDIEIAALIAATVAWGNRKMICRNADKILNLMDREPLNYVMDEGYEDLPPELNLHRTFFAEHLQYLLRGLRNIYIKYGSIDNLCSACNANKSETPAWILTNAISEICKDANNGKVCSRAIPSNLETTALKRINMALRWLVRNDGIVDMGVWASLKPSQLYIPLDVHVGNTARSLALLERRSNDKKAVIQLTKTLRQLNPDDPVFYDYALFGIGITAKQL